jgi:hypothetical protein
MRYTFHIRPSVNPDSILSLLANVSPVSRASKDSTGTAGSLAQSHAELRKLGLITSQKNNITDSGQRIIALGATRPHLVAETIHAIYHRLLLDATDGSRFGGGWAYQKVCASLWKSGNGAVDHVALISEIITEAASKFNINEGSVAFSKNSLNGITKWLGALDPKVYRNIGKTGHLSLRHVCPPEAVWWAVDALHYSDGRRMPYGVRVLLTESAIKSLCQQLLVAPESLDRVLLQAKRRSDLASGGIFDTGMAGGMGRWVLLAHEVLPGQVGDA